MSFDIGPAGDLSIFTNSNDDVFNISGDTGPSLILEQGFDSKIAEVNSQNVASDVIIDRPSETLVDFSPVTRQRIESNSSEATVEPMPIKKKINKNSSTNIMSFGSEDMKSSSSFAPPPSSFAPLPSFVPNPTKQDLPPFKFNNFDDLLDSRKLKEDNASVGGESHSTINQPNSPDYRSPIPSPMPSPMPSTFQSDRRRVDDTRRMDDTRTNRYVNDEDEKMDLLLKLRNLEQRGKITISKTYNMKSNIEDIRMEYRNQTSVLESQASVKFYRNALFFCASGIEYANRRFDPVGAKLDGWGEHLMETINEYDGIFEKIHEKYGSMGGDMDPIVQLLCSLGMSAAQYHLTKTYFKDAIPQLGQVLRENPDVINGFANVAREAARRSYGEKSGPMAANETNSTVPSGIDFSSILSQVGISNGVLADFAKTMANPLPHPQATRDFDEPPVNDLYRQMVKEDKTAPVTIASQSSERKAMISPMKGGGKSIVLI
jgi:Family of unknown function (DUF5767)